MNPDCIDNQLGINNAQFVDLIIRMLEFEKFMQGVRATDTWFHPAGLVCIKSRMRKELDAGIIKKKLDLAKAYNKLHPKTK